MSVSMDIDCPKCGAKMQGPLLVSARCVERLKFSCRCGYVMTHPAQAGSRERCVEEAIKAGADGVVFTDTGDNRVTAAVFVLSCAKCGYPNVHSTDAPRDPYRCRACGAP